MSEMHMMGILLHPSSSYYSSSFKSTVMFITIVIIVILQLNWIDTCQSWNDYQRMMHVCRYEQCPLIAPFYPHQHVLFFAADSDAPLRQL